MKKYIYAMVAATLSLAACTNSTPDNFYTINGQAEGLDGKCIYLVTSDKNGGNQTDSALVTDGKFEFSDSIFYSATSAYVCIGDPKMLVSRDDMKQIYIEPGTMTMLILNGDIKELTLTGSQTQDEFVAFSEKTKDIYDQLMAFNEIYYQVENRDSINELMEPLSEEYQKMHKQFIKDNPNSCLSAEFLTRFADEMDYDELKEAYETLTSRAKNTEDGESIAKTLNILESLQPGKPAPIIAKDDLDGNPFSMADLKGKVILLDFWASWCKPCRASNPHVLEVYKKYHDKGLEIVFVGDNDSNPDELRKAIEEDGVNLEGMHHLLRGLKTLKDADGHFTGYDRSEDVTEAYNIHYIPTKYVIDREGNIVGKAGEDEEDSLEAMLEKLFAE